MNERNSGHIITTAETSSVDKEENEASPTKETLQFQHGVLFLTAKAD
jgi:hypothetical protein